jgi:hypothetical protein
LRLLDSEQLEFAFQAQGITLQREARSFYSSIWEVIKSAEKIQDSAELNECISALRTLCQRYFARSKEWLREEQDIHEMRLSCEHSDRNRREAQAYILAFEKEFFRYTMCYLELNRVLIQKRVVLAHFAKDYNLHDAAQKLEVNNSTGLLLSRAHKERHDILLKRQHIEKMHQILRQFDHPLETLGKGLPDFYGQIEGDRQLTLFKGALRQSDFKRARKICQEWSPYHRDIAMVILDLAAAHEEDIKIQNKLLLHTGETSLVMAFIQSDEKRLDHFLQKFNVPYMLFQYRHLMRQGYLLGRIGSIESLIIYHAKLIALAVRACVDPVVVEKQDLKA